MPEPASTFARLESSVRSYCRSFPAIFERAQGAELFTREGRSYIDFLAGAGSLNYGHNPRGLREALVRYLLDDGITHSLDLHTVAKGEFLATFEAVILKPRGLDYVAQFTGPTGTNAVEAALKLARQVTGRRGIIAFTNGFHGVSLGALAATGHRYYREPAGTGLPDVHHAPYDGYHGGEIDTVEMLARLLDDPGSGVAPPAAFIVETVQGEGGLNAASKPWLRNLAALAREVGALLIVDDIQTGCGRTGSFFSFETAGITPDLVTLSKSLSGYGLPFSLTLIRRDLDRWAPGAHNGTFRGNNHAFVTATAALREFWTTPDFAAAVQHKAHGFGLRLAAIAAQAGNALLQPRGRGLMRGLRCAEPALARAISREAFARGLIVETCGPADEVVKCLPPLTTPPELLARGLAILAEAVDATLAAREASTPTPREFALVESAAPL